MATPLARRAAAAALLAGLALTGCTDDDQQAPTPAVSVPADLAPDSSTPSNEDTPASAATAATATSTPGRSTARPTTVSGPVFPPAFLEVQQGDTAYAVYLAVSRVGADGRASDPAALDRARAQAEAVGYDDAVGGGSIGCDQGAAEALRLDPGREYTTAAIFFRTAAQAQQFVDAYEPGVVGIAEIKAFCLD